MNLQQCKYPDEILVVVRAKHFANGWTTFGDQPGDPCALSRAVMELGEHFSRPQTGIHGIVFSRPGSRLFSSDLAVEYEIEGCYTQEDFYYDKDRASVSEPQAALRTIKLQKIREY